VWEVLRSGPGLSWKALLKNIKLLVKKRQDLRLVLKLRKTAGFSRLASFRIMMKYFYFIRCILKLWWSANWYQGVDKPNFWQRVYSWRLSLRTSIKVAKNIWLEEKKFIN
jgi:hypothetical protein